MTTTRRSRTQINLDRRRILDWLAEQDWWARPPAWAKATDVDALAKAGSIEVKVKREFDKQGGYYAPSMFGGAGVVMRRRKYIRLTGSE